MFNAIRWDLGHWRGITALSSAVIVPPCRSLQVKELGAAVYNCSCLAKDLGKIFEAYWALGIPGASIPVPWPANYSTTFNMETPLELKLNDTAAAVYFSVRPRSTVVGFPSAEDRLCLWLIHVR